MNHAQLRVRFPGRRSLLITGALAALLALPLPSSAATITGSWQAKIGSGGANGTASVVSYLTGTGSVTLKLAKLKPSTLLPVAIYKGTCSAVGGKVVGLASIKTTSKGAATRTSALTAAQTKSITTAAAAGKLTVRVGSGATLKCGAFTAQAIAPYVAATITAGIEPQHVTVDPTGVYTASTIDNTVTHISPATNQVLSVIHLPIGDTVSPQAIVSGAGALWVTTRVFTADYSDVLPGSLLRIDPASGAVTATIPVGINPFQATFGAGSVWVANWDDGTVTRVDAATNQVLATIDVGGWPMGLAFGEGALWVADEENGDVIRVDPATNSVAARVPTIRDSADYLAVANGALWVADYGTKGVANGVVTKIDIATGRVGASIPVGTNPVSIDIAGGYAWVSLKGEPTVVQIALTSGTVVRRIAIGAKGYGIAATDHAVWVAQPTAAGADSADLLPGTVTRINY